MKVIECNNLTKVYSGIRALNNISFTIEENKITGLIGRNGAGKTTLLKMIAGFYRQTSGSLLVFSGNPFNNLRVSQNMIFIDDNMVMPTTLNLKEILASASTFYPNWDQQFAERLFNYFSLDPKQRHLNLSKGMKSTFNMIIGLAARCPLTIFDEPTTGMDAAVRKDFYRALLKDYLAYPRTIILSSHLLNEIDDLLEDILLIKNGEKFLHTSVNELKQYALGLSGTEEHINHSTTGKEILYKKIVGTNSCYVVVKNDYNEADLEEIRAKGIEITAVDSEDICVYLTNKTKGGIDDVFNRN
ncbi:ABC transporter ATP-binding protein [Bacillaceae bacterium IKA-2]|nr:ABC transporter ATP-binding protein [Bacillaceae bacterium IKA-2]